MATSKTNPTLRMSTIAGIVAIVVAGVVAGVVGGWTASELTRVLVCGVVAVLMTGDVQLRSSASEGKSSGDGVALLMSFGKAAATWGAAEGAAALVEGLS